MTLSYASKILFVVAGALKCYLRELPEPLMTFELYNDWFKAAGCVLCMHYILYASHFGITPVWFSSPDLFTGRRTWQRSWSCTGVF